MRKIKFLICVMSLSIYSQLLFAASLYFPIKEIDLGSFVEGEKKTAYYYFVNENNQDVVILNIRSSIKATLEKYNPQTKQYDGKFEYLKDTPQKSFVIPAHSQGRVTVMFDSYGRPGNLAKSTSIFTATDTIRLRLKGQAIIDKDSPAALKARFRHIIGGDTAIAFRDLYHHYGQKHSLSADPIPVSKNDIKETKLHFIVQSGYVSAMDVLVDGVLLDENRDGEPLSFVHSVDTFQNAILENTLTFSFDTRKVPQKWGIVEKDVTFLINGAPAKGNISFKYDILEDTAHMSKTELMQAPRLTILNKDKKSKYNVWHVGQYPLLAPYTCTIKIQNTGKKPLIFRDDMSESYDGTVMSLGSKEPEDIDFVIDNRKFAGVTGRLDGRYAEVHVNKSIVQPNEVAELTITGYAYPIDLMSYNEHTKHQYKYNLYKLTIRTNDPYQNYIDLYFLYSIEDKD